MEADLRSTRFRPRVSTPGEADLDRLFPSTFHLAASLGGLLEGDSRVSRNFFLADDDSGDADEDDDRPAGRAFDLSSWSF